MSVDYAEVYRLAKLGKRAEGRRKATGKFFAGLVKSILTTAVVSLGRGLWLMLAVGVVHDEWVHALPTLGYWWAVLLIVLLNGVLSAIHPVKTKEKES